jgi:5-methylcytosine-specific restriction protein A
LLDKPGFCDKHRRDVFKRQKQVAGNGYVERNRFYQRAAWKALRAQRLSIEPLCRECRSAGRLVEAAVVDHIVAITDNGEALALDNTQSLCVSCHNRKTHANNFMLGRGVGHL